MSKLYRQQDWYVFPCVPGGKEPAVEGGFNASSNDPTQIAAWEAENPDYNWAVDCGRSGLFVIDIDGDPGENTWFGLTTEHGEVSGFTVKTPRGGRHIYTQGQGKSSVHRLGDKVDTRGEGGYVLLPGSEVYGKEYRIVDDAPILPAPVWAVEGAGRLHEKAKAAETLELDQPHNIARVRSLLNQYVKTGYVAIEGQGGDSRTIEVINTVFDLGVSEDVALQLLEEKWNPACEPPWDTDELITKIENAVTYRQNELGAWAGSPSSETFADALGSLVKEGKIGGNRKRSRLSGAEMETLPPPTWLVPDVIQDETVGMIFGASQTFKTFLALDIALALATGIPKWGLVGGEQKTVIFVAGEAYRSIGTSRVPAWRLFNEFPTTDHQFYIEPKMPLAAMPETLDAFIDGIIEDGLKPSLIIIDTLAKFMGGLDESNAKDANLALMALESIKERLRCSVVVLHHTGKDKGRGARGSSAFDGGFDAIHELTREEGTKAIALWPRKHKDADVGNKPYAFEVTEFANSLVLQPITQKELNILGQRDDQLSGRNIGRALRDANVLTPANAITTHALADLMTPPDQDDTYEDRERRVAITKKALTAGARGKLAAYCNDDRTMWSLTQD